MRWDSIPARWVIHWEVHGEPNGWATKTVPGVYGLLVLPVALMLINEASAAFRLRHDASDSASQMRTATVDFGRVVLFGVSAMTALLAVNLPLGPRLPMAALMSLSVAPLLVALAAGGARLAATLRELRGRGYGAKIEGLSRALLREPERSPPVGAQVDRHGLDDQFLASPRMADALALAGRADRDGRPVGDRALRPAVAPPRRRKESPTDAAPFQRWATDLFRAPLGRRIFELEHETLRDGAPTARRVARLGWLFENAGLFAGAPSPHVGQAVWFLASESDGEMRVLCDETVAPTERARVAAQISVLFERLLARVCRPNLSHTQTADEGPSGWANTACYMFWDICPISPIGSPSSPLHASCLEAMEATLAIPHIACQEAALHGLGHWRDAYPQRVDAIIAAFLARSRRLPAELEAYAKHARVGRVQ
jgi:hypothetical protein